MQKDPDADRADQRDESEARDEHTPGSGQTPRLQGGEGPVHREAGQYAAGADGTQQVSANTDTTEDSHPAHAGRRPMNALRDPLPPSPVAPDRVQPPIEPEK